mgnify:CR=1 FL=1
MESHFADDSDAGSCDDDSQRDVWSNSGRSAQMSIDVDHTSLGKKARQLFLLYYIVYSMTFISVLLDIHYLILFG